MALWLPRRLEGRYPGRGGGGGAADIGIGWESVYVFTPGVATDLTTFPAVDLDTYNYKVWGGIVSATNLNLTTIINGVAGSVLYLVNRLTSGANTPNTSEMVGTGAGESVAIPNLLFYSAGNVAGLKRCYVQWQGMRDAGGSISEGEIGGNAMWTGAAQPTQLQLKTHTATGFGVGTKLYFERRRKVPA